MVKIIKIKQNKMSTEMSYLIIFAFVLLSITSIVFAIRESKDTPVIYPKMKGAYSELEFSLINKINKEREFNKLLPLVLDDDISLVCNSHLEKCVSTNKVSHVGVTDRYAKLHEGLCIKRLGEILGDGSEDTESLLDKLLQSSKDIILGDYDKIGISTTLPSNKKVYVSLILIK